MFPKPREATEALDRLTTTLTCLVPHVQKLTMLTGPTDTLVMAPPLLPTMFPALESIRFETGEHITSESNAEAPSLDLSLTNCGVQVYLKELTIKALDRQCQFPLISTDYLRSFTHQVGGRVELRAVSTFIQSCPSLTHLNLSGVSQDKVPVCWKLLRIHSETLEVIFIDLGLGVCAMRSIYAPKARTLHLMNAGADSRNESIQFDPQYWS